jgi:hypothetical protein
MRSMMSKSMVLAGAFLLVAGATTKAAASSVVEVKVPFPFVVNGRSLPAGQYMVERDDTSPSVLLIRGEKGNHTATFVSSMPAGGQDPAGSAPVLLFKRDENQYRLSSVWESSSEGWNLTGR